MAGYPLAQLHREVAVLGYHFHWPLSEILALPHRERELSLPRGDG
jgi:hypothetical protein